jgi:arginine decarboxylase
MDRHGVQINKTSRNTALFMTNIGTTRSSVAFLVEVLVKIARELDEHISEMGLGERSRFEQKVRRLTARAVVQPDFSGFHSVFRDHSGVEDSPEGDVRRGSICPMTTPTANTSPARRSKRSWTRASTWSRQPS